MEMDNISNSVKSSSEDTDISVKMKEPKKILYFSDGTIEEFSDDNNEDTDEIDGGCGDGNKRLSANIDEHSMKWGPWLLFKAQRTGDKFLSGCDYVGEGLASFLGITTPKYASEIEEYKRIQEERLKNEQISATAVSSGWLENADQDILNDKQPNHQPIETNDRKF